MKGIIFGYIIAAVIVIIVIVQLYPYAQPLIDNIQATPKLLSP